MHRLELLDGLCIGARKAGAVEVGCLPHVHDEERANETAFFHLHEIHLRARQLLRVVGAALGEVGGRDVHVRIDAEHLRVDGLGRAEHGRFIARSLAALRRKREGQTERQRQRRGERADVVHARSW